MTYQITLNDQEYAALAAAGRQKWHQLGTTLA